MGRSGCRSEVGGEVGKKKRKAAKPARSAKEAAGEADRGACDQDAGERVFQFKITLKGTKPPIWRRIQVPESYSFWDLHVAIQDAMGWEGYHLHEFSVPHPSGSGMVRIGQNHPGSGLHDVLPEERQRISDWFRPGGKPATYTYDFGDDWQHTVKLEKILPREEGVKYPRCTGGKRACPPEDCGGPWGYRELLDVLADPLHEEYEEVSGWVGEFDPERFHPDEVVFSDPAVLWRLEREERMVPPRHIVGGQEFGDGDEGGGSYRAGWADEEEDEEEPLDPRLRDLLERIDAGDGDLKPFTEELEELIPGSTITAAALSQGVMERLERGEITAQEAEAQVTGLSARHPLSPLLFEIRTAFAMRRKDEVDVIGFAGLAALKSQRLRELTGVQSHSPIGDVINTVMEELLPLVHGPGFFLDTYEDFEGGSDDLIDHYLVEDILRCGDGLLEVRDPGVADLAGEFGLLAGFMAELDGRPTPVGNTVGARAHALDEALRFMEAERSKAEAAGEEWDERDFLRRSGYRLVYQLMHL